MNRDNLWGGKEGKYRETRKRKNTKSNLRGQAFPI